MVQHSVHWTEQQPLLCRCCASLPSIAAMPCASCGLCRRATTCKAGNCSTSYGRQNHAHAEKTDPSIFSPGWTRFAGLGTVRTEGKPRPDSSCSSSTHSDHLQALTLNHA